MQERESEIKKKRTAKGMTQYMLADYCHVDQTTVSKWEAGLSYPDVQMAKMLSSFLGLSMDKIYENDTSFDPLLLPVYRNLRHSHFASGEFEYDNTIEVYDVLYQNHRGLLNFQETYVDNNVLKEKYFAFMVSGQDMSPHFLSGDILIVERDAPTDHGDFVIGSIDDGLAFVCILNRHSNGITFAFTGSPRIEFCPISQYNLGKFHIHGRVVKSIRDYPKHDRSFPEKDDALA